MLAGMTRSIARAFARMSNSHLRRSSRAISTYAFTVPSSLNGGVSRQV